MTAPVTVEPKSTRGVDGRSRGPLALAGPYLPVRLDGRRKRMAGMNRIAALQFDKRLTPARPDLADERLRGRVAAGRYSAGRMLRVIAPSAPLRREPRPDAPLDTEVLMGEAVTVYGEDEGWAWGQLQGDGYVG